MGASLIEQAVARHGIDRITDALPPEVIAAALYVWRIWARPEQLPPDGAWRTWLLLAGRGFGKSRTGAEWCRDAATRLPGSHGALVGPTAADVRDVMVKALLACSPPGEVSYEPSKRLLTWENGTTATTYSAEEPDRLRGPQHHWAWADEIAAWAYAEEVWDMLQMTLRLGDAPQVVATTTPRPIPLVRRLLADATTSVTRGSTFDNARNLSPAFLEAVRRQYDGTRLGRQELYAEVLDDVPGALWTRAQLDADRVKAAPELRRSVVAVDPSGGHGEENDAQGIVVVGLGIDGHGYVLADRTCRLSPDGWGRRAVVAYVEHKADRIVYERNFGGEMCEHVLQTAARDMGVRIATLSVTSSRGKILRAEPIAALDEQHRVHHVGVCTCPRDATRTVHRLDCLAELEDEMCSFTQAGSNRSPNRVDARVFALTELMLAPPPPGYGYGPGDQPTQRRV